MNPLRRLTTWLFPPELYLTLAKQRQKEWEQRTDDLLASIGERKDELEKIQAALFRAGERVTDDLKRAEELERDHKITIDALRAELEVCEGTVKALEASHSLILKRIDADLAVQTRREVAMQVRDDVA